VAKKQKVEPEVLVGVWLPEDALEFIASQILTVEFGEPIDDEEEMEDGSSSEQAVSEPEPSEEC
jgi:hypothetical protein